MVYLELKEKEEQGERGNEEKLPGRAYGNDNSPYRERERWRFPSTYQGSQVQWHEPGSSQC